MPFAHEKLQVYQKGLACFAGLQPLIDSWPKRHAFVDHLSRGMESMLFNLAEAAREHSTPKKRLTLDYALGSTFECAACFDIAVLKGLLGAAEGVEHKRILHQVCKMMIGLRNSWKSPRVAENEDVYNSAKDGQIPPVVFHHEQLDMYAVSLEFYRWLVSNESGKSLRTAFDRSTDKLATRIVLNIAEGNGRYTELSQQSFLDIANAATIKLAVCLDAGVRKDRWSGEQAEHGKRLLLRVGQMTARKDYGASA